MIMIGHGYASTQPGGSSLCPALEIWRICMQRLKQAGGASPAPMGVLLHAREHDPTTGIPEARLADLEGAEAAAV
jgi:hypothetical protein